MCVCVCVCVCVYHSVVTIIHVGSLVDQLTILQLLTQSLDHEEEEEEEKEEEEEEKTESYTTHT